MQQERIRPGIVWYVIAGLINVICIVLFVLFLVGAIKCATDSIITRVTAPGTASIEIDKAGKYTIYFEHDSVLDGKVYHTSDISDILFTLTSKSTGEQIDLNSSLANTSYSINGRSGQSIFDFDVSEPGEYILETIYDTGTGENAVLAVGRPFVYQMVMQIFLSIGSLFCAIIVPVVIFVITIIKRSNNKRLFRQNAASQNI